MPRALAAALIGALATCIPWACSGGGEAKPNILLVLTDDQRHDTLRFMPVVMRELVGPGVRFENAFVSVPACCPSRASTFSGRWAHNTGVVFNRPTAEPSDAPGIDLPNGGAPAFDESSSIALLLQQSGYRTGLYGKYLNAMDLYGNRVPPGWDEFHAFADDGSNYFDYTLLSNGVAVRYGSSEPDYSTDVLRDLALDFLDQTEDDEPFLLVFAPFAPHFDAGFYSVTPAPRHAGTSNADGNRFLPRPPSFAEKDRSDKPEWLRSMRSSVWASPHGIAANVEDLRHETIDSLLAVDEAVEAVLERLERSGAADRTLIVFTSDNGLLWGEHRLGQKSAAYEESIRVPLVIRPPGDRPAGTPALEQRLVGNVDLAPTFAALAGATGHFDGRSLLPLLDGSAHDWRDAILIEGWLPDSTVPNIAIPELHPPIPDYAAVRTRDHKYVDYATGSDELYDLSADPFELENRIDDPAYAEPKRRLATALARLRAE